MTSDEWTAHQAQRKAQRERDQVEARQREIDRALATLAKHGHQAGDVEDLRAELEALKTTHQETLADLEAANLVVDKDYQVQRLGELTQGLRDRDHFDRFRELATEAKMHPSAIKHLWKTAEFKAESDQVDHSGLNSLVARLKTEHDYAFQQPAANAPAASVDVQASTPVATASGNGFGHVFDRGGWRPS